MPTCFVIQPFDKGKFDKRYEQTFAPAIKAADLAPYRVDKDVRVEIPIEAIEAGIRDASICLADITTDNPNVWYELGYAMAMGKPVVMICSTEREGKYPFDIQHRTVIPYKVDAPNDFAELQAKITDKLKALIEKNKTLQQIAAIEPLTSVAGLSQAELTVLATLAGSVSAPNAWESLWSVKQQTERDYLTPLGFSLALRRLLQKRLVEQGIDTDNNGYDFPALRILDEGWAWIDENEALFVHRKADAKKKAKYEDYADQGITDEDIPF